MVYWLASVGWWVGMEVASLGTRKFQTDMAPTRCLYVSLYGKFVNCLMHFNIGYKDKENIIRVFWMPVAATPCDIALVISWFSSFTPRFPPLRPP